MGPEKQELKAQEVPEASPRRSEEGAVEPAVMSGEDAQEEPAAGSPVKESVAGVAVVADPAEPSLQSEAAGPAAEAAEAAEAKGDAEKPATDEKGAEALSPVQNGAKRSPTRSPSGSPASGPKGQAETPSLQFATPAPPAAQHDSPVSPLRNSPVSQQLEASPKAAELASFAPPITEKQQLPLLPSSPPLAASPAMSPQGTPRRPGASPGAGGAPFGSPMSEFKTPTGRSPSGSLEFGGAGYASPQADKDPSPSGPKLGAHSVADQSLLANNSKADGDEWRGWTIQTSPQGKLFFHHIASNTSQWQMPPELGPVLGEWSQVEEDGKRYWRNEKLGVSSWKDPRRTTNLFQAALDGNLFFLQLYTEVGGFLDAVDSKGRTALHYNCAGGSAQAVHYLLQHGASVDLLDRSGSTPLHWAARYGHAPIVRLLLESKAHPDYQNSMGDTAMHEAAALGLVEPLQWLVLAKANATLRNRESRTPAEVAERASAKDVLQLLQLEEEDLASSESDAARARRRAARAERARRQAQAEVTSPEADREESEGEDDEPSLALVVVRAARPILRSVQWLANRVLGEKKTNLGDTSQFSYDHLSGQWILRRPSATGAEEESASSTEDQTWSLPETQRPIRRSEESDGGMA